MRHRTMVICWYGPFTLDEVFEMDAGFGLYMVTGKLAYQRRPPEIQYIGITERAFHERLGASDHSVHEVTRDQRIWLGEFAYPARPKRVHLELAESAIIYVIQPPLNIQKTVWAPATPTTVVSHWFKPDGEARINQRAIYRDLPDVISWDGELFRTGNLTVWEDE